MRSAWQRLGGFLESLLGEMHAQGPRRLLDTKKDEQGIISAGSGGFSGEGIDGGTKGPLLNPVKPSTGVPLRTTPLQCPFNMQ